MHSVHLDRKHAQRHELLALRVTVIIFQETGLLILRTLQSDARNTSATSFSGCQQKRRTKQYHLRKLLSMSPTRYAALHEDLSSQGAIRLYKPSQ